MSTVIEQDFVESLGKVVVKPGDTVRLMNGKTYPVFWVGIHRPSYLSLIGVRPCKEKGAVPFRAIHSVTPMKF